jgi:hypothetical protein
MQRRIICNGSGIAVNPVNSAPLGPTDQRSKIGTFNIAPTWTRLIGSNAVFTFGGFVRKDQYNYYPSADPFADFSPGLQAQTITQDRKLTNAGVRTDISYVKGIHNIKAGITYEHTFLTESDTIATVDPGFASLLIISTRVVAPFRTPPVAPSTAGILCSQMKWVPARHSPPWI